MNVGVPLEYKKSLKFLSSWAYITSNSINAYWGVVGYMTSSCGIYSCCSLPSAYVRPLTFTRLFSFIGFIMHKNSLLCCNVRVSVSIAHMSLIPCICLYYFNISVIYCSLNTSISFFPCIWIYLGISSVYATITPNTVLWKFVDRFCSISSLTFINLVLYDLPQNFIWSLSIFPVFDSFYIWMTSPSLQYLVSTNLRSLVCTDPQS